MTHDELVAEHSQSLAALPARAHTGKRSDRGNISDLKWTRRLGRKIKFEAVLSGFSASM